MAFDREAAKQDGYTDQEIDNYLATKDKPLVSAETENKKQSLVDIMREYNPQGFSQPMTPEQTGTAQFGAAQAAKYLGEGALGYGAYRGLKNIAQNFGKPPAPTAPPATPVAAPPGAPMEPGGQALRDFTTQQGRYTAPSGPGMMDRFGQLAQQYGPVLQKYAGGLSRAAGPAALATYSRGLNTGEDEELKRQRARMEEAIRMEAARKAGIP